MVGCRPNCPRPLPPRHRPAALHHLRLRRRRQVDADRPAALRGAALLDDQIAALDLDSTLGTTGGELDFALLVDGLAAEREQAITIDVAYRYFGTRRRSFIVADTPGHEQYTRNMATGASTADLAIILIDARKGLLPQTRRHSFIVSLVGVRHVVVAINKMDLVGFDARSLRARSSRDYRTMRRQARDCARCNASPSSARDGDNISTREHADALVRRADADRRISEDGRREPATISAPPFRFPVQWVSRPNAGVSRLQRAGSPAGPVAPPATAVQRAAVRPAQPCRRASSRPASEQRRAVAGTIGNADAWPTRSTSAAATC